MTERIHIFNMFCPSIVIIIILALSVTAANYDFKCPATSHRKYRSKWLCNSTGENYSCLLDIQRKKFKESCTFTSDFVRPGQKYVISGLQMNINCSNDRFQPFKFYSSELSKCVFVKTLCSGEGQIIFSEGSIKEDRKCRCDYTKGYAFLSRPTDQCLCNPGEADCSCYIVNCLKNSLLLSDHACKDYNSTPGICQPIDQTRHRQNTDKSIEEIHAGILQSSIKLEKRHLTEVIVIVIITVIVIAVFTPIVIIDLENIITILRQTINMINDFCCKRNILSEELEIADGEHDSSCQKDEDLAIVDAKLDSSFTKEDLPQDLVADAKHETDTLQTATDDQSSDLKSDTELLTPEEQIDIVCKMYESLKDILQMEEFNKDLQNELSEAYPNADYMNVLNSAKRNLVRNDCGIVITGETSAGKTTLINRFVGTKLFPTNNVAATATVCRIRNSKELMLKAYTKDECLLNEVKFKNMEQMKSVIKKFTDISYIETDIKDKLYYTDVYLPVPILKGNVIIVDTPGIGESEELDNILLNFLPQAVSFIFIVNARNAGGIHEDRLSRIFRNIWGNIEFMPCFNPMEVFFLTNQWDIVADDDDDDDNDDRENETIIESGSRTWKLILNKLRRGWPGVENNRIYQISLNPMSSKNEGKYTTEFQRFETDLTETILRNQNKQVKFYLSFLQNFVRNAERGIAARLKLLDSTEEEHNQIIIENLTSIERLEEDNKKFNEKLTSHKSKLLNGLVNMLFEYIHSNEAKNYVLNPKGSLSIENYPPDEWESVITSRLNCAIEEWLGNGVVKEKMEEANVEIMSAVKEIEVEIENVEIDMTGIQPQSPLAEQTLLLPTIFELAHPDIRFWHFPVFVMKWVFDISKLYYFGQKQAIEKAEIVYEKVLEGMTKEKLQGLFENSFGKEYSKTISRLFDCDIPNKIKSMKKTNESMMAQYLSLRLKHESFHRLNTMMEKLKAEIRMYQDTQRKNSSVHA